MTSKLLTAFLFLALVALVVAQKNATAADETNVIDQCIKKQNCAADDRECRAACAGVPDPDPKVANDTIACYEKCGKDNLPDNEEEYKACTKNCREDIYQEGVTEPGSTAPSKSQGNNGDEESSGDGKSSNGSSNADDSGDAESGDKDSDKKDDSGASLTSQAVLVYVFAAVLACAAFTGL